MSKRIGIIAAPGRGHLYPAVALARRLVKDGFAIVVFDRNVSKAFIHSSDLEFRSIDSSEPRARGNLDGQSDWGSNSVTPLHAHASLVLKNGQQVLKEEKIEALLVDQADLASGSIAESLGIPFLNVSMFLPVYLDELIPPFIFPWPPGSQPEDRIRNRRGNRILERRVAPIITTVNRWRLARKLRGISELNEVFSKKAIVTQVPRILDFPRPLSHPQISYTGPFCDEYARRRVDFPWNQLNGKPIIYASMGSVRCNSRFVFEMIVDACRSFDCQLVLSLGGMSLIPSDIRTPSDNAIIVHFAPQIELLSIASLCISHGGMNSVLEALMSGVPLVLIPVTDDQPGVAARVEWCRAGLYLPVRELSVRRLREIVGRVLLESDFSRIAALFREDLRKGDGIGAAARVVASQFASF
jgi:zeaxanthin glucosyltransferase